MELTTDQLISINKNRVEVGFKKGEIIFKQGALAAHIVYIKKGLVKLVREHSNDELIISLESRGTLVGLQSLFGQNVYPYSVVAYEDVNVCLLDLVAVKELTKQNASFSSSILKLLNEESAFLYNRMACLTLKQLHGRFADLLLCLSLRIYKRKAFNIPLTKKDMAAIMNMSQESLSRVVKEFKGEKIIDYSGNKITILNYEKIRHLSLVG